MFERRHAITVATALKSKTEIFVTSRNCLSVNRSPVNGRIRFSEKIEAGANIAELAVLRIAESNEPKKRICTGIDV